MRAVLALALVLGAPGLVGCHDCGRVPECASPADSIFFGVTTSSAMVVSGVQATLTGPVTVTMSCEPTASGTACRWPSQVAVTAGTYSLQVSAPGYQPTLVQAEVTLKNPEECGCTSSSFEPSTVPLSSADAGTD